MNGAGAAEIRDIPASCICGWRLNTRTWTWQLRDKNPGCPWHTKGAQ